MLTRLALRQQLRAPDDNRKGTETDKTATYSDAVAVFLSSYRKGRPTAVNGARSAECGAFS